jgi:hypothetical protein
MKPAFIRWHGQKNGQERRATLRSGVKGQGQVLQVVNYWPTSGASMEAADRVFAEVAKREGYTIVGSDRDEE